MSTRWYYLRHEQPPISISKQPVPMNSERGYLLVARMRLLSRNRRTYVYSTAHARWSRAITYGSSSSSSTWLKKNVKEEENPCLLPLIIPYFFNFQNFFNFFFSNLFFTLCPPGEPSISTYPRFSAEYSHSVPR